MKAKALPTQAQIKEILHYDPETGIFRWRYSVARMIKPWSVAGTSLNGYRKISINNRLYYVHRLAWIYMTGKWPKDQIDHIDGQKFNNSWSNLREATNKQNNENQSLTKNNTSGFRGVSWYKKINKWSAKITHHGKSIYIGLFVTAEDAGKAAADKRAELFTHDKNRSFNTTEKAK